MIVDQMKVAAQALWLTAVSADERIRGRDPVTRADQVPAAVEQLTAEWLTAVLTDGTPGTTVNAFELGEGSAGTSLDLS